VTNRTAANRSFILVPQTDRRQLHDRRAFPRGGRRGADLIGAERESSVDVSWFWSASPDGGSPDADKPVLH